MKILHVDSGRGWRGGQKQVYLLCKGLLKKGIPQSALVGSDKLFSLIKDLGIPVKKWNFRFEFSPTLLHFFRMLSQENPDIIHFHDSRIISLGLLTTRKTLTTRRVDFDLKNRLSVFKYKKLDRIVAISEVIREILQKAQLTNIEKIYSGIDPELLKTSKSRQECRMLFNMTEEPVFINIASLEEHKGHIFLLQALKILKSRNILPRVHIAGSGSLKNQLMEFKEKNSLHQIHFHGHLDNINELLKAGDFFIMTSIKEGLCTSLMDAMYFNLPIIATKAGGMPELLADCALIAQNKNPDSIAQKIETLISSKKLQNELLTRAKTRVLNKFLYTEMVESYYKLYQNI
jgi:glycosyltransferase involved in cell wall biosynthesis